MTKPRSRCVIANMKAPTANASEDPVCIRSRNCSCPDRKQKPVLHAKCTIECRWAIVSDDDILIRNSGGYFMSVLAGHDPGETKMSGRAL